jgi:hypothetical protein
MGVRTAGMSTVRQREICVKREAEELNDVAAAAIDRMLSAKALFKKEGVL